MRSVLGSETSSVKAMPPPSPMKPKSILHLINGGSSLPESPANQTRTVDLRSYQYQDHLKEPIVVGGGNITAEKHKVPKPGMKSDRVVVFKKMSGLSVPSLDEQGLPIKSFLEQTQSSMADFVEKGAVEPHHLWNLKKKKVFPAVPKRPESIAEIRSVARQLLDLNFDGLDLS